MLICGGCSSQPLLKKSSIVLLHFLEDTTQHTFDLWLTCRQAIRSDSLKLCLPKLWNRFSPPSLRTPVMREPLLFFQAITCFLSRYGKGLAGLAAAENSSPSRTRRAMPQKQAMPFLHHRNTTHPNLASLWHWPICLLYIFLKQLSHNHYCASKTLHFLAS